MYEVAFVRGACVAGLRVSYHVYYRVHKIAFGSPVGGSTSTWLGLCDLDEAHQHAQQVLLSKCLRESDSKFNSVRIHAEEYFATIERER